MDGQDTKWHRNSAENFNRLSWVHERYRQDDDIKSEHELEFTFAKTEAGHALLVMIIDVVYVCIF